MFHAKRLIVFVMCLGLASDAKAVFAEDSYERVPQYLSTATGYFDEYQLNYNYTSNELNIEISDTGTGNGEENYSPLDMVLFLSKQEPGLSGYDLNLWQFAAVQNYPEQLLFLLSRDIRNGNIASIHCAYSEEDDYPFTGIDYLFETDGETHLLGYTESFTFSDNDARTRALELEYIYHYTEDWRLTQIEVVFTQNNLTAFRYHTWPEITYDESGRIVHFVGGTCYKDVTESCTLSYDETGNISQCSSQPCSVNDHTVLSAQTDTTSFQFDQEHRILSSSSDSSEKESAVYTYDEYGYVAKAATTIDDFPARGASLEYGEAIYQDARQVSDEYDCYAAEEPPFKVFTVGPQDITDQFFTDSAFFYDGVNEIYVGPQDGVEPVKNGDAVAFEMNEGWNATVTEQDYDNGEEREIKSGDTLNLYTVGIDWGLYIHVWRGTDYYSDDYRECNYLLLSNPEMLEEETEDEWEDEWDEEWWDEE